MSDQRFPYLNNFLKPTRGVGAKSDNPPASEVSALLAPGEVRPGDNCSSGERTEPQALPETILSCTKCPWYQLNPWTHYPELRAWCHRRMKPLATGSPACEEFRRGEVPVRQDHELAPQSQAPTSPAPQEHILTCSSCPHFEPNDGPNPQQAWGRCLKRNKGRYGCATACEAALAPDPEDASNRA
jgi:hypothetical protein